jgi:hypothetical protein
MSAVKFQPSYKLFEPDYHPERPIIVGVDDRLESPETVTLRYEEAARGDPRGDSPPSLIEMAAYSKAQLPSMHGYDSTRYQDASYDQYQAQAFQTAATDKFAQLNQQSFGSNNAVASYMPTGASMLSIQPSTGMFGTKVFVKVSCQYDLFQLAPPMPYFYLVFGSQKCPVEDMARDTQDQTAFVYSGSVDAPQFLATGCAMSSVPVSLVILSAAGEDVAPRIEGGTFQYLEGSDDITRTDKMAKHETGGAAANDQAGHASPKAVQGEAALPVVDATTNSYEYPAPQAQYASTFPQATTDMITTYRTTSFTDPHYHGHGHGHGHSHRRHGHGWSNYASALGSTGRSPALDHPGLGGRPSLTPLPMPSSSASGAPQLIRTSTIANGGGSGGGFPHMSLYSSKAVLNISGNLSSMAENWTQDEWDSRRRIVMFRKTQQGSTLTTNFRAVSAAERPPNSICVSCIWWAEKSECYVTSVDTIHLLEQLVAAPSRFSVEEKNRIRRNLEGFHPQTVSKTKPESEEFFKVIMAFPNPKPRNIEKDVKVFPWKILEAALKKIIGKYSANPSSTHPPASLMTPVSAGGASFAHLPTPPGQGMASQQSLPSQGDAHGPYGSHHDSIPSPRSLSSSQQAWTPYTTASGFSTSQQRTLSPGLRHGSPQHHAAPPMRLNTTPLPAVTTYDTRTVSTGGAYGTTGLHTPISHHPSAGTPPRWDAASASYSDSYPSLSTHHTQNAQSVYGTAYGDGSTRA